MRILAVDLSGLFWTNWHATADKELGAAYDITTRKVSDMAPEYDRVVVAIDRPPYKRKELSSDYKAQRDEPAADALDQMRRTIERMRADGHFVVGADGYEADDVIATVARVCAEHDTALDILSADKDLLQLVSDADACAVISPRTNTRMMDEQVSDKFGVPPAKMRDLLALMGDTSDNVPGIRGVGQKKAAALLTEYGDLASVLRAAIEGTIGGATGSAIANGAEQLELSRKLVTLHDGLPIEWDEIAEERKPEPLADACIQDAEFEETDESPSTARSTEHPKTVENKPQRAMVVHTEWDQALEPANMKQAHWLAVQMLNSRSFGVSNEETALAVIMKGRSLGLDAVTSLTNFHIIKGKPVMSAQLIIGMVKASPKCLRFQLVKTTNEEAVWRTQRVGEDPVELQWTLEDARQADLLRKSRSGEPSNWEKMPRTMLRWRCGVELARAVYPDVVAGVYSDDEMESVR